MNMTEAAAACNSTGEVLIDFSPVFLNPSAIFVAAFLSFRSIFSPSFFCSIFFAALVNSCSILLPTFLGVSPIRYTILGSSVGSPSACAVKPVTTQTNRTSQKRSRNCRCIPMTVHQPHQDCTTTQVIRPSRIETHPL